MNENTSRSLSEPSRWSRVGLPVALVAAFGVLTVNVWLAGGLVQQQRSASRERDFWLLCQPGSTPLERETAFRHLVAAGNREWRSADLWQLNLAGVALAGADLQGATFLRTNLAGANLAGAVLRKSNLELADLTGADLSQANLREARLAQALLRGATLRRANLGAGSLAQAQAENADFSAADLSDTDCLMARLDGAKLRGANLSGARMASAVLKGADLAEARLDGADLTDTDFTNANWWAARGLTTAQLGELKKKFPPTAQSDPALYADFERWAAVPGSP